METEINGIILNGRVYKPIKFTAHQHSGCRDCCFYIEHGCGAPKYLCRVFEGDTTNKYIFRFSQELTDKINER